MEPWARTPPPKTGYSDYFSGSVGHRADPKQNFANAAENVTRKKRLNEIAAGERHPLSTGEPVGLLHLPIVNYTISTTQHYNIIQLGCYEPQLS